MADNALGPEVQTDLGSFGEYLFDLVDIIALKVDDLRLQGALGAFIQGGQELGVIAQEDGHVILRGSADQIENFLVAILFADQVDFIENKYDLALVARSVTQPELIETAAAGPDTQQRRQYLKTGIVLTAVGVGELQLTRLVHNLHQVASQQALPRAARAQNQGMIGDIGLLITQNGIDERLGLLTH